MSIIKLPGAIDLHVHLREPSDNKAETIKNGSLAAAHGGFSLICDMPNNPGNPTWTVAKLKEKIAIAKKNATVTTLFYAGSQPESNNIAQLESMASAGAVGLKLYGAPTTGNDKDYTAKDFEQIIKEWHRVAPDKPIMLHAGADNLEDLINLVTKKYSHHLHICHVHSSKAVKLINSYKTKGYKISCGVCPHHLLKTSHETLGKGWFSRMQPPLANQDEAESLLKLFAGGAIDLLESDYAPHTKDYKLAAETNNPHGVHKPTHTTCFGVPGIEHIMPIMLSLVRKNIISLDRLIDATHTQPIKVLGLDKNTFGPAKNYAKWDISDQSVKRISEKDVISGSDWSPYVGYIAGGKLIKLVSSGKIVHETK
ncbi:hypothetical protein A3F37_03840 [Candidatus Saccharibacteria bacterium RIFCSPHIGHO2_12_FULL_41_12]|nr:MAG: hypothetical protein A3F37_03840 [Candidatus Saccharibacteria bacterium RIFCSPHIGHO2_12_FULL_41_12]